ncbi:MAG: hypothetical protein JSR89_07035 [Proteobacteria bacterium]|nr:hypothetical protein [Pseudomonadota bacterium]
MTMFGTARLCLMTVAVLAAATGSARAIDCDEDYQIVQGRPVSTPYCRDNYLAAVARTYGYKVSDSTIRNNPSRKAEICRFIGSDIRVYTACEEVLPGSRDTR